MILGLYERIDPIIPDLSVTFQYLIIVLHLTLYDLSISKCRRFLCGLRKEEPALRRIATWLYGKFTDMESLHR